MIQIAIKDIKVDILVGCNQDERIKKQQVIIDVVYQVRPADFIKEDNIASTVDYSQIPSFIEQLVYDTSFFLLEALASYIAKELLKHFLLITEVTVAVFKPHLCHPKASSFLVSAREVRKYKVAIGLGANIPVAVPIKQLIFAIEALGDYLEDVSVGGLYETTPYGMLMQDNFYNTALIGYTTLPVAKLFSKIKLLEKLMGKEEKQDANAPRIIDIDLLFYDDIIYQKGFLTIPHVAIAKRDFVLQPLCDIDPNLMHPLCKKTVKQLLAELTPAQKFIVKKVSSFDSV